MLRMITVVVLAFVVPTHSAKNAEWMGHPFPWWCWRKQKQIPFGNDNQKDNCNGKGSCNYNSKNNYNGKNNCRSFDYATLRSG
ncbi:MAG TPA: hypothetical protein VIM62_00610 [Acidobacteriaceae bacterium]